MTTAGCSPPSSNSIERKRIPCHGVPSSRPPSQLSGASLRGRSPGCAGLRSDAPAIVDRDQQLAVIRVGLDVDAVDQGLVAELAPHPLGDPELDGGDRQVVEALEDRAVEADAEARSVHALARRREEHREDLVAQVAVGVVGDGDRPAVVAQLERLVDEELGHQMHRGRRRDDGREDDDRRDRERVDAGRDLVRARAVRKVEVREHSR